MYLPDLKNVNFEHNVAFVYFKDCFLKKKKKPK